MSWKRTIRATLLTTLLVVAFRGQLFRYLVKYDTIGARKNDHISSETSIFSAYLKTLEIGVPNPNLEDILSYTLSLTSSNLYFTTGKAENLPERLHVTRGANCIGYAAYFTQICNTLLTKHQLDHEWKAQQEIGQLFFLGKNVHHWLRSPFLRDHDFVIITNSRTGQRLAVDPSIHDCLRIDSVTLRTVDFSKVQ